MDEQNIGTIFERKEGKIKGGFHFENGNIGSK